MVKLIKRTTDNTFLNSLENDIWVADIKDALEMTYRECETIKKSLLSNNYNLDQLIEIVNLKKYKPITEEEKKELLSLLNK